jgi:hypothetical protein
VFEHHLNNQFFDQFIDWHSLPVWPVKVVINWNLLSVLILRKCIFPVASPTKHCRDNSSIAIDKAHDDKV